MKFLIAEDDVISRLILKKTLEKEGYKVIVAQNGREGLEIFQREKQEIYLAIIDWMMPEIDGIELCKRIKAEEIDHYIYVIFLSARSEKKDIVTGLNAGADDYLIKPFEPQELLSRIKVGLRIIALEQRLKEANKKLEILAITDGLTGILNRRAILERLKQESHRAIREGYSLSIIMADIDHFKKINDTYGHQIGDKILKEMVNRLKNAIRPYDLIGRYGGEEFIIIIPKLNKEKAMQIAERLRKVIYQKPFNINEKKINISISLGTTILKPSFSFQIDTLIKMGIKTADNALYKAKKKGRNCVIYQDMVNAKSTPYFLE